MKLTGEFKIILGASLFALIPMSVVLGEDMSPYGLLLGRLVVASLILFVFSPYRASLFRIGWGQTAALFGWSQLMLGAMISYFFAIQWAGMSVSSALLGTQPVMIVFLAALMLKEKIGWVSIGAALLSLCGVLCITGISDLGDSSLLAGEILAVLSALLLSLNFILQKKYLNNYSGKDLVFYSGIFQLPFLIPLVLSSTNMITFRSVSAILILAVFCTVLSYSLIYEGIKTVDGQKIGVLQSIEYALPMLLGVLFFGEIPQIQVIIGVICILIACIAVSFTPSRNK